MKSHTAYLAKGMGASPFFYSKSFIFLSLTSIRFSSCIRPSSLDSALRFTPKNSASAVCVKGTWDKLPALYQQMLDYANKNNLQLTGYAYEVGLNDFVISDEADYITKIVIKIQEIS